MHVLVNHLFRSLGNTVQHAVPVVLTHIMCCKHYKKWDVVVEAFFVCVKVIPTSAPAPLKGQSAVHHGCPGSVQIFVRVMAACMTTWGIASPYDLPVLTEISDILSQPNHQSSLSGGVCLVSVWPWISIIFFSLSGFRSMQSLSIFVSENKLAHFFFYLICLWVSWGLPILITDLMWCVV